MNRYTGRFLAAHEAPAQCGVPAGTVRRWAHERRLFAARIDRAGRPLYRIEHILELAAQRTAPRVDDQIPTV